MEPARIDEWWNDPAPPAEPPRAKRAPRPPFLDVERAAARVELTARRALDNRPEAYRALTWYADARRFCVGIGRPHGLTVETVAGAVAALSPQVSWREQVSYAPAILDAWAQGLTFRRFPGPGYNANKRKAARILAGGAPLDVLGGPKVRAFYRAITSAGADPEAVCIDRHAWALACGAEKSGPRGGAPVPKLTDKRYREAAAAFTLAAERLRAAFPDLAERLTAPNVQALVWEFWRASQATLFPEV